LGSVEGVPSFYVKKASKQWWKYVIPGYFPAYKPMEIEEWPAEVILEHLGAIQEMKRHEPGGEHK
jgi:hypothetical protein